MSNKVKVTTPGVYAGVETRDVEADDIGSSEGELVLFKDEKVVAVFAPGYWRSAELMPQVDPRNLPS